MVTLTAFLRALAAQLAVLALAALGGALVALVALEWGKPAEGLVIHQTV